MKEWEGMRCFSFIKDEGPKSIFTAERHLVGRLPVLRVRQYGFLDCLFRNVLKLYNMLGSYELEEWGLQLNAYPRMKNTDCEIINSQPASNRDHAALTDREITPGMRPGDWSAEVIKGKCYILLFKFQ